MSWQVILEITVADNLHMDGALDKVISPCQGQRHRLPKLETLGSLGAFKTLTKVSKVWRRFPDAAPDPTSESLSVPVYLKVLASNHILAMTDCLRKRLQPSESSVEPATETCQDVGEQPAGWCSTDYQYAYGAYIP